jgi:hypothetical protein
VAYHKWSNLKLTLDDYRARFLKLPCGIILGHHVAQSSCFNWMVEKNFVWQNMSKFQMILCVAFLGRTHPWVVPLQGMVEKPKVPNHFPKPFPLYVFRTIIFFFHVYPLHALKYGLKFILE